jgi:hypothetical protein
MNTAKPPLSAKHLLRGFLIVAALGGIIYAATSPPEPPEPPTPEATARAAEADAWKKARDHDLEILYESGTRFVESGALKYSVSGWQQSLDVTLPNLSAALASKLSQIGCGHPTQLRLEGWSLRVYLVDGQLAAQCKFGSAP